MTARIPTSQVAIAGDFPPSMAWYRFFKSIQFNLTDDALKTEVDALDVRVTAIEAEIGDTSSTRITGVGSIYVSSSDIKIVSLDGDLNDPGNTAYYGTDNTGTKGWSLISTALGDCTTDNLPEGTTNLYFHDAPSDGSTYGRKNGAWAVAGGSSPLTVKGDIYTFSTVNARLAVGADTYVLTADSTQATGLKWAIPPSTSPLTTKGDVYTFDTANARLPIGANTYVLTADSTQATGMKWAAPSGGGSLPVTTKGDLVGFSTVAARVPVGADGTFLAADSTAALGVSYKTPAGGGGGGPTLANYLRVEEQAASGVNGSASVAGFNTRKLGTVVTNNISGSSLGSYQVTLPAGTYRIECGGTQYQASVSKLYVYNVTTSAYALVGHSTYSDPTGNSSSSVNLVSGYLVLSSTTVISLRHYFIHGSTVGFGVAASDGNYELYAWMEIWKVA